MQSQIRLARSWRAHCIALGSLALFASTSASLAQCPDGGAGPDVIVGLLTGPSNYTSVGGIDALTIGTTSCNVGDTELLWIASTNQHPVIGQNLFRLQNGRFAHIGQAWLKHGFFALQQNACICGCNAWPNGSRLGVGCSDPYDSGLNGDQNGMGPKWQVNAANGAFTWPPANFSATGNSIFKRLQVAHTDLDPALFPQSLYFVEGQYVSPDDAANGNKNNNASYRRIFVSGGGSEYSFNFDSAPATVKTQAALRAWKDTDPSVVETDVDIPGDGLVILSMKAIDEGGGITRYEYAVQNLNSDRSISSFSVPATSGTNVFDIGFHDVPYHSGEPWDGTDWVGQHVGDEVVWTCPQTFDENPNANALRWGTLYNFWFRADAAPAETTVTLGLFKPGAENSVTARTVGPESAQFESIPYVSFNILQGTHIGGGIPEVSASDDQYAVVESVQIGNRQQSNLYVRLDSPVINPQQLDLTVELSGGVQPNTKCSIFLRNWTLGGWDRLELFQITSGDVVKSYPNIANPNHYIRSTNGDVRVRILTLRGNTTTPFDVNLDHVDVSILP